MTIPIADGVSAAELDARALAFGHVLRQQGIELSPAQLLGWLACFPHIDLTRREEFRDAARAALLCFREDQPVFERTFDRFWGQFSPARETPRATIRPSQPMEPLWALDDSASGAAEAPVAPDRTLAFSAAERLRHRDFGALTAAELASVLHLAQNLRWEPPYRRSRRFGPAARGRRPDLRRTLRGSLRHGGELLPLARRARRPRPRPLVLLCDVSGSMERYARLLLQFLYVVARRHRRVETFVFSTRLTRVTRPLQAGLPAAALDAAVAAATDWGGGTRIGATLHTFNSMWARRVLGRGAVVLILSDGCDRGDVALLAQEMARLHRNCHRLIWLNPLRGQPGYTPGVRGMQAALPHVDAFLPLHNLASLEQLAATLYAFG